MYQQQQPSGPAPWEQQSGESDKSFAAFCVFRDIGSSRSVHKAYVQSTGKTQAKQADGRWNGWASQNNWHTRASAWDGEQDRVKRQANLKAVAEMGERHAAIALGFQSKVAARLKSINPEELSPADMERWFKTAAMLERLARGEPDSITETKGQFKWLKAVLVTPDDNASDKPGEPQAPPVDRADGG